MATRSYIGFRNSDDTVDYIYCHFDGYPSNNGKILVENYEDPTKVNQLLRLGDLSILGAEIGEKHDFNDKDTSLFKNWCLAYGRDRGEANTQVKTRPTAELINDDNVDYVYIFDGDYWECYDTTYKNKTHDLYSQA
jgi:hypothetical protein